MIDASAHQRALDALELDDIFVVDLRCSVLHDVNQTALHSEIRFQHRFAPQETALTQKRVIASNNQETLIFRFYVEGDVRLIKPEVPAERDEFTDEDVMAQIRGVIAVDYVATRDIHEDVEAISAFGSNVLFHAWPYWRTLVMCRAAELRLPRLVLPMMRQARKRVITLESDLDGPDTVESQERTTGQRSD